MKELQTAEPCMKIFKELRDILVELKLRVVKNLEYGGIRTLQRCDGGMITPGICLKDRYPKRQEISMVTFRSIMGKINSR